MDESVTAPVPRRGPPRALIGVLVVLLLALLAYVLFYRSGGESSDDAFIDGHAVAIASKVAGFTVNLPVRDNQHVQQGDLLVQIDPRDFSVARDTARAQLSSAEAQLRGAQAALALARINARDTVVSAQAQADSAAAALAKAAADLSRLRGVDARATTQQTIDAAVASEATARAQVADAQARLKIALAGDNSVRVAQSTVEQTGGQVDAARAQLAQAELNLGYAALRAPFSGRITRRLLEPGGYVQVGQSLMTVVSDETWVTANFKESQLARVAPGRKVEVRVDAYPDLRLTGVVDSIQAGTGSRFTTFPTENATGNYVKIVQRVPVKIVFDSGQKGADGLPLGLSVVPRVLP